ncbi:MAG: polysaccharide deacetylase family protein [Clostridia bacterium]|nr:polysaccharide deacetylase family protein [Clostridia bacterium]
MEKPIQKIISALLSILFCVTTGNTLSAADAKSWYCKRQKDHLRPTVEQDMAYVEDYGGVYLGPEEKVVYLTFDAGYENGNVARILDTLKKHGVQGAFFILENLVTRDTALVRRMAEEGHLVCNHTARHKDMTAITPEEIAREIHTLEEVYREKTGCELARFFRPPEGKFSEESMRAVQELGYTTVFWSLAYADWDNAKQPSADYAKRLLTENLHDGAILLLHPTSKTNADILDELITAWKAEGYRFGSLTELVGEACE